MYCDGRVFAFDKPNVVKVLNDCSVNGNVCVEYSDDTAACVEPHNLSDSGLD